MKSMILRGTMLAAGALALAGPANADVLFSQAYDGSGIAYSSQNDTGGGNGNFATVFDNFSLASDSNITGLSFTGVFFNPPDVGNITGFTVNFHSNTGGQPGAVLQSTFFGGNGGQACVGAVCTYDLGASFGASAGTTYWMSIVPDVSYPPQWGWAQGTGGDGVAYQDFFGSRSALAADLAFTLTGVAGGVPEPSAWALMILGFGVVGAGLRAGRKAGRHALV